MISFSEQRRAEVIFKNIKMRILGVIIREFPARTYETRDGRQGRVKNFVFEYQNGAYKNRFGFCLFGTLADTVTMQCGVLGTLTYQLQGRENEDGTYGCAVSAIAFEPLKEHTP